MFYYDDAIIHCTDYPMCLVPAPLKTFFNDLLKKCTEPTLKLIYQRSVENMVQELSKGTVTVRVYCTCIDTVLSTKHCLLLRSTQSDKYILKKCMFWVLKICWYKQSDVSGITPSSVLRTFSSGSCSHHLLDHRHRHAIDGIVVWKVEMFGNGESPILVSLVLMVAFHWAEVLAESVCDYCSCPACSSYIGGK